MSRQKKIHKIPQYNVKLNGIWDFGLRVSGSGLRVSGFGFRVSGLGLRVSVFEFRASKPDDEAMSRQKNAHKITQYNVKLKIPIR